MTSTVTADLPVNEWWQTGLAYQQVIHSLQDIASSRHEGTVLEWPFDRLRFVRVSASWINQVYLWVGSWTSQPCQHCLCWRRTTQPLLSIPTREHGRENSFFDVWWFKALSELTVVNPFRHPWHQYKSKVQPSTSIAWPTERTSPTCLKDPCFICTMVVSNQVGQKTPIPHTCPKHGLTSSSSHPVRDMKNGPSKLQ